MDSFSPEALRQKAGEGSPIDDCMDLVSFLQEQIEIVAVYYGKRSYTLLMDDENNKYWESFAIRECKNRYVHVNAWDSLLTYMYEQGFYFEVNRAAKTATFYW